MTWLLSNDSRSVELWEAVGEQERAAVLSERDAFPFALVFDGATAGTFSTLHGAVCGSVRLAIQKGTERWAQSGAVVDLRAFVSHPVDDCGPTCGVSLD